ncbi:hypothetical protein GLOTRDRAFT_130181 [Gloeophyllum trabeum ATCC 11539]|uniref:Uncharacterized protein n=1 Tax=Gloeophyllum trabeum (strain ATCC 11539 / FP-39264 / Madison 617) TaxID=670483 RepID=S7Q486_GLOTA|nr:uncharacterized protein GLOTRDRAFT_130181 [Gloeophyllum trabeum ATCC 11539]EPQ54831.1 hypothetical protein GLOTRDRAFT_130181 [Gloeophyllum trabeum ATCC 11539]
MPTITPSANHTTVIFTASVLAPRMRERERHATQILMGLLFGTLFLALIGILFFCGHRYHQRKHLLRKTGDTSWTGCIKRPFRAMHILLRRHERYAEDADAQAGVHPMNLNAFPPPPSRASTFDQRLPEYAKDAPGTEPIAEERQEGTPKAERAQ